MTSDGEGNGNPLQYSCLENPMDGGAWWATYSPRGRKESDTTERLHFTFWWKGGWTNCCLSLSPGPPLQAPPPREGRRWVHPSRDLRPAGDPHLPSPPRDPTPGRRQYHSGPAHYLLSPTAVTRSGRLRRFRLGPPGPLPASRGECSARSRSRVFGSGMLVGSLLIAWQTKLIWKRKWQR